MRRRPALLLVTAAFGLSVSIASAQDKGICARDLLVVDSSLRTAIDKLNVAAKGSDADRCGAWRNQIAVVKRSREVYGRCAPDRARTPQFLQTASAAGDLEKVVKDRCK